jgi:hypothetical protein
LLDLLKNSRFRSAHSKLDGALVSGLVKPGSRLRVYRGALARQVVECLAVDDHRGLVHALWSCFGRQVERSVLLDAVTVTLDVTQSD